MKIDSINYLRQLAEGVPAKWRVGWVYQCKTAWVYQSKMGCVIDKLKRFV